ncbi:MAG: hypothetical protein LBF40_01660 [Deltaproteobacteria bacterium]|nr:hypothetical protein [Deltaproteobacteria bacterium]
MRKEDKMNNEFLKILDHTSLTLLRNISNLEDELNASDLEEAREVGSSIPAILMAIALQKLSLSMSQDEVSSILRTMIAKVEIGDFHSGSDCLRFAECEEGLDGIDAGEGSDDEGKIPH